MATPYQLASTQANLLDTLQTGNFQRQQYQDKVSKQKFTMAENLQKQIKKAQEEAKKKANKNKGLFKGLNLLSSLFDPTGISKGFLGYTQGAQEQSARKKLLGDIDYNRLEKTFLRNPAEQYKEQAEDLQMSGGDVFKSALGSGMAGRTMQGMFGLDEGENLFQKMFEKGEDGKTTPFKNLSSAFEGGFNDMESMQKNIMIPMLLEIMMGGR